VLGTETESRALPPPQSDGVELRDQLIRLLVTLTARERKVVVLRYYFDLPEDAVAEELSVTRGTVKSTASRALAKLRHDNADVKGVL
jgi:RNA polymerase sigma factor (sigma-70 family)